MADAGATDAPGDGAVPAERTEREVAEAVVPRAAWVGACAQGLACRGDGTDVERGDGAALGGGVRQGAGGGCGVLRDAVRTPEVHAATVSPRAHPGVSEGDGKRGGGGVVPRGAAGAG